jgi:hypothetical protein
MDDRIEFEEPEIRTCECCGRPITSLTRFVYRGGDAFAVYYLNLDHDSDRRVAYGLAGFGEWGEDEVDPREVRVAFAFRLANGVDTYELSVIDADASPWRTEFLGRRLTRAEALQHPLLQELYDLSDHILRCDGPAIAHFS